MVNEEKVKLMTKMALYEKKEGSEDFRISAYYKKDYVSYNTILTIILVTIGYAICAGLLFFILIETMMAKMDLTALITAGGLVVAGYIILVVLYVLKSRKYYGEKHIEARNRVKQFNRYLTRLDRMYERERKKK